MPATPDVQGRPVPRPRRAGRRWRRRRQGLRPWPLVAHLAVTALAGFTYLWRLGTADWLADEVVYAQAARAYLDGDLTTYNPEHPVLAKYLIGLGEAALGAPGGTRLAGALSGLALTALVYAFVRRAAGWQWGLVGALTWLLLPHALPRGSERFGAPLLDRFAMLDPVAAAFALLALLLGWRWARSPGVGVAALTGGAVGLATAAKLPGVLVAPVIAVAVVTAAGRSRRTVVELAAAGAAALTAYLVLCLPAGSGALSLALSPVTEQLDHAGGGHLVLLAGTVYERAPWWSHLYFHWRDDGPVVTVVLLVLAASALAWSADRRLAAYLAGAVVVPLGVLSASPVALPHYRMLWVAPLVVLAVLGLRALLARALPFRVVGVAAAVAVLVVGGQSLVQLAGQSPGPYSGVACAARALGVADGTAVVRGYPAILGAYLPDLAQSADVPAEVDLGLLDPRVTDRTPAPEVVRELVARGYPRYTGKGLDLYVAPRLAARAAAALPGCGLEPVSG